MKKWMLFLCALGLILMGYRIWESFRSHPAKPRIDGTILCFGDSLTYGTGASEGMDYPAQLSRMLGREVINAGVAGDTTARALKRLRDDVLVHSPDAVLITLGGNDLKNGIATKAAFANLKAIVESIQRSGAVVVIGGLSFPMRDRGYGKAYRDLADQTGAILIPDILDGIMGDRTLMSDPIHPNDAGYARMAERFYEALQP
jgi:acyl-CoA thioesterase-1